MREIFRLMAIEETIRMLEEIENGQKTPEEATQILAHAFKTILKNILKKQKKKKDNKKNFYI